MNIFDVINGASAIKDELRPAADTVSLSEQRLLDYLGIDSGTTPRDALSQVTYFVCLKKLSESVGELPVKLYKKTTDNGIIKPPMTATSRLLSLRPNPYQTSVAFWTMSEYFRQHYGNSYVYIDRKFKRGKKWGGKYEIKGLYPMHPDSVEIWVDDADIFDTPDYLYYKYTNPNTGEVSFFPGHNVMHFKNWLTSEDGLYGLPVRQILKRTFAGVSAADEYLSNLYQNGMMAKMVVQYSGNLSDPLTKEVQERFLSQLQGPKAAGKVIPVPTQFQLVPLSQSLVDSEFSTLKKYSAVQIASCFGIFPSQINDFEHTRYASSEAEGLAFLTGTLGYILRAYEAEINSKILTPEEFDEGYYYKFNEKALLRVDSKTQAEILQMETDSGMISRNEAREILDYPNKEGADELLVNGAYIPVNKAGLPYADKDTGGEKK